MSENKKTCKDKEKACTSVFKDGGSTPTREIYTEKWVELINAKERGKSGGLQDGAPR